MNPRKGSFGCLFSLAGNRLFPRKWLFALILLGSLAGCAANPVTGDANFVLMTESQETALGARADQDVKKQYALYDLHGLQAYVDGVGQKLARHSHRAALGYRFTVLDSTDINAFALPGGYVYITRGILAYLNSEAELAAVLGHEIGHVNARHSVRQISVAQGADVLLNVLAAVSPAMRSAVVQNVTGLLGNALLSGYGREHELEADRLGAEYLARSGYDPQAMIRVIGVLKNQELFDAEAAKQEGREPRAYHGVFASHPDNDTRLKEVVGAAEKLRVSAGEIGRERYLEHTAGMVFGDNAYEGFVRAGSFYHPDLGFALKLPSGWRTANMKDRLVAAAPGAEARLELRTQSRPKEEPADFLRRLARGANDIEITLVNGLPAAIAMARGQFAATVYLGNRAYLFSGTAKSDEALARNLGAMRDSVRSFRALGDAEKAQVKPLLLKPVAATEATRFAELARSSPLGRNAEGYLRLINGIYPAGEPKAGDTIRIVE